MDVRQLEHELGATLELTGSRRICPAVCDPNADWDYIGLVDDMTAKADWLLKAGWESATSLRANEDGDVRPVSSEFVSLKKDQVNLILTGCTKFRDNFLLATRTATKLGLTCKSHRIALFQALLYGNG